MPNWWMEEPNILKIGSSTKRRNCLDLGCGKGDTKNYMEGEAWVGIDIKISKNISINADTYNLPFRDNVFELIMSFKVLEHLKYTKKCLKEIKRVLKNNGYFIGSVAFLEIYHESFYHFTHLGLKNFLITGGFIIEEITPGWSVFEAIINSLVPSSIINKISRFLAKIFYKSIIWIRRRIIPIYFKNLGCSRKEVNTFLKEDELRLAGELRFIAHLIKEG